MKFYDSILNALRKFTGKPDATEAELDNIMSEQTHTLAEILNGAGVTALTEQVNQMTERLNGFEANLADLNAQLQERDNTITSLQSQIELSQGEINARDEQITALNAQIEQANTAHTSAVNALSAQIAALKAGKDVPKQEGSAVQLPKETEQTKVTPIQDKALAEILGIK